MKGRKFLMLFLIIAQVNIHAQMDTLWVDLGNPSSASLLPWNNLNDTESGSLNNLLTLNGYPSTIGLRVTNAFRGVNSSGTLAPNTELGIPSSASEDSFFGNTVEFNGATEPSAAVEVSGLIAEKEYQISLFASRIASDNRQTQYIVEGLSSDTLFLQVSSNSDSMVHSQVVADMEGKIRIRLMPGPANDNTYGFYYLGAIRIVYEREFPPPPAELSLEFPRGGEVWQVNETPYIKWHSNYVTAVQIEYSQNGQNNWRPMDTVTSLSGYYQWSIPKSLDGELWVRVLTDQLTASHALPVSIVNDSLRCPIVVIGSSTAAGSGANPSDSSWVNRYSHFMYQNNTRFRIINLARGGYNSFHLIPTGSEIPDSVNIEVDEERNITKALSFDPYVVIVNLPSNDAARYFGVEDQMYNFSRMANAAEAAGAEFYVCTTQPRNFSDSLQVDIQRRVRDSIHSVYGEHAIDFWTPLARNNGHIEEVYDSGDGVHVNNHGHRLLFEKVREKMIQEEDCDETVHMDQVTYKMDFEFTTYPNPSDGHFTISFENIYPSDLTIQLFDVSGKTVAIVDRKLRHIGWQKIDWTPYIPGNAKGIYYLRVELKSEMGTQSKIRRVLIM